MVEKFVVFDALTGETRIEEIEVEVPDIKEEEIIPQPTIEERINKLEEVYTKLLSTLNIEI